MNKETTSAVSSLAGKILSAEPKQGNDQLTNYFNELLSDAKVLAGSCLSQDETPGQEPANFLDRLKSERAELDTKIKKLVEFLNAGALGITERHKEMLDAQASIMICYIRILDMRLQDLGERKWMTP